MLRINFQIPIDLLVIIIATFIGYELNWGDVYEVKIMKDIPTGLPAPKLPRTDFLFDILYDALGRLLFFLAQNSFSNPHKLFSHHNGHFCSADQLGQTLCEQIQLQHQSKSRANRARFG